jgi:hypothetical protein
MVQSESSRAALSYVEPLTIGEMSEWFKEHAWKACVGVTPPWVRIPLSPFKRKPLNGAGFGGLCNWSLKTPPGPEGSNGIG